MLEVVNWTDENRLVLNLDKTNVMVIGSKSKLSEVEDFNVTVEETVTSEYICIHYNMY